MVFGEEQIVLAKRIVTNFGVNFGVYYYTEIDSTSIMFGPDKKVICHIPLTPEGGYFTKANHKIADKIKESSVQKVLYSDYREFMVGSRVR